MEYLIVLLFSVISLSLGSLPNNTNCGKQYYSPRPVSKRIVGGQEVWANSWPWMVALKFDSILTCGGTLVRTNNGTMVVITGAYCGDGSFSDETRWEARIGFHSRASAQYEYYYEKFNISRIIIHPEFSASTIMNDIAIFVLDGDVVENPGVAPACVTQEMYQSGENCVTLGWGNTLQGGTVSDRLQEVYKPILDANQCSTYLGGLFNKTGMLCAGFDAGGAGPCFRDSGGPLLCKRNDVWYLTGIVSWGFGCGQPQAPPVYTNVFEYVVSGWLTDNAAI